MSTAIRRDIHSIFQCDLPLYEAEAAALTKIRKHDEYTYLHSLNVARLSVGLGIRLGLNAEMIVDLGWAALLHDIGKLHVPLEVLNKLKKFTPDELAIMQSHPVEALAALAETQPITLDRLRRLSAAFEHHQRYDLKGYPIVQKKLTLHPFSRIVAVADTFDAMTTDRIYQRRILPDMALKIMAQGYGTVFDPLVLQGFITAMGAYPVGSLIRLDDQRLAVVTRYLSESQIDRPEIFFVDLNGEGNPFLDLSKQENAARKILRSEFPEDFDVNISDTLERAKQGSPS